MRLTCVIMALALPICAADVPGPCVKRFKRCTQEPPTLSALVTCQKESLEKSIAAYKAQKRAEPPESLMENWQDRQRAETRDYLARHPDRASLDAPENAAQEPKKEQKGVAALAKTLQAESDGGKNGVTPEMVEQINEYLQKNQGSVSPEMKALLEAVQKDGAKLTDDTVSKLKDAAQSAKSQGLDLNVDKKTEDFLLAPKEPSPNQN